MASPESAAASLKDWDGKKVPPGVYHALETPYRGQTGIGKKMIELLDFYEDVAVLVPTQLSITEGTFSPEMMSPKVNVKTKLILKKDSTAILGPYTYHQIKVANLLKKILDNDNIDDQEKARLCSSRSSAEAQKWLASFNEREHKAIAGAETTAAAMDEAELASLTQAERNQRKRQQTLSDRVVHKLSAAQMVAIHYTVATFFFLCRIPFQVIEHWAFTAMLRALNPAYVPFRRTCLSTSWLDKLYGETEEKLESKMDSLPGKKTVIIDGFKDRVGYVHITLSTCPDRFLLICVVATRRRHVMNITHCKPGLAAYVKTAWFGRNSHGGDVYAEEVKATVGDGKDFIACCADNTSSNTGMQRGMFGILTPLFPSWFFLGCCVHCMDLLSEDIAKIPSLQQTIKDYKFITVIVLRYSMLHETFLDLQKNRAKIDKSASMGGLKIYPDTRFAYAFLMVYAVVVNWSVITVIPDSPEFKVLKRNAKEKRLETLQKFEDLVQTASVKRRGEATVGMMRPISTALHFLESDNLDSSCVVAVYCAMHQNALSPSAVTKSVLSTGDITTVADMIKTRWLGRGQKVGIRNNMHCLAWKLDLHMQLLVKHLLGDAMLAAIEGSFRTDDVEEAIETYAGGNATTNAILLEQYQKLTAKSAPYTRKHKSAELIFIAKLAPLVSSMDDETKENPLLKLLYCTKNRDLLCARQMYTSMKNEASASHEERLFTTMSVDILGAVTHACSVERINKGHGFVHSKARANMSNETTRKALYAFTNESLLHTFEQKPAVLGSYESFLLSVANTDDSADILATLSSLNVSDYLPAERDDAGTQRRRRQPRMQLDDDDDDDDDAADDDDDDDEGATDGDQDDDDDGELEEDEDPYVYVPTSAPPDGFEIAPLPSSAAFIPEKNAKGLYILLCCDDLHWMMGKVVAFKPRNKSNFTIQWKADDVCGQLLTIENFYVNSDDATPTPGKWLYLKKSPVARQRVRRRGGGE